MKQRIKGKASTLFGQWSSLKASPLAERFVFQQSLVLTRQQGFLPSPKKTAA